jgi:hypothetical protein
MLRRLFDSIEIHQNCYRNKSLVSVPIHGCPSKTLLFIRIFILPACLASKGGLPFFLSGEPGIGSDRDHIYPDNIYSWVQLGIQHPVRVDIRLKYYHFPYNL